MKDYAKRSVMLTIFFVLLIIFWICIVLLFITNEPVEPLSNPPDQLDIYIDTLAHKYECETGSVCDTTPNYRRKDSNGKYSYSCLQFQKRTFIAEVKKYKMLPYAEDYEIMNMIYDCDFQKKVARNMFENDPQAYLHWKTSTVIRGLGVPPLVSTL